MLHNTIYLYNISRDRRTSSVQSLASGQSSSETKKFQRKERKKFYTHVQLQSRKSKHLKASCKLLASFPSPHLFGRFFGLVSWTKFCFTTKYIPFSFNSYFVLFFFYFYNFFFFCLIYAREFYRLVSVVGSQFVATIARKLCFSSFFVFLSGKYRYQSRLYHKVAASFTKRLERCHAFFCILSGVF